MGGAARDAGGHEGVGPRALVVSHFQWCRVYGANYEAAAGPREARKPPKELLEAFFAAIRDNNVGRVAQVLQVYPHLGFTKCFGSKQRTALYVASFFARFEVVKLLVARGADRALCCEGVPPRAVVGYGRHDAVDEMKVRCQLIGAGLSAQMRGKAGHQRLWLRVDPDNIHVILVAQSQGATVATRRVLVHFSDGVEDLIEDDLVVTNCSIVKFTQLSGDLFAVEVRAVAAKASVQVPAGVARRRGHRDVSNVASNILAID